MLLGLGAGGSVPVFPLLSCLFPARFRALLLGRGALPPSFLRAAGWAPPPPEKVSGATMQ